MTPTQTALVIEIPAAEPAVHALRARLDRAAWFGDTVLWLAPTPDQPFRTLTAALARRFPQAPPYGGAHHDLVPHLTIGHDHPREDLETAAAAVLPHLPIHATATAVRLLAGNPHPDGGWHPLADFPLAPPAQPRPAPASSA